MTKVGEITITQEVDSELIDNLLCTALDASYGGSNYWIDQWVVVNSNRWKGKCHWPWEVIAQHGAILITDIDGERHDLTLNKMLLGLSLIAEKHGKTPVILEDDHDADDADAVLQYAVFNKLVYG